MDGLFLAVRGVAARWCTFPPLHRGAVHRRTQEAAACHCMAVTQHIAVLLLNSYLFSKDFFVDSICYLHHKLKLRLFSELAGIGSSDCIQMRPSTKNQRVSAGLALAANALSS